MYFIVYTYYKTMNEINLFFGNVESFGMMKQSQEK